MNVGNLVGLPGVEGGKIEKVPFAFSVDSAMRMLLNSRAVTGAGDHGAWTVWKDDSGAYRCEFGRHRHMVAEAAFNTEAEVRAWLEEWLPRVDVRATGSTP